MKQVEDEDEDDDETRDLCEKPPKRELYPAGKTQSL